MFISYHLANNHNLVAQLAKELAPYKTIEDLNVNELEKLPLLNAVLFECLRMYPPIPIPTARVCPSKGITIDGCFIAGGVSMSKIE